MNLIQFKSALENLDHITLRCLDKLIPKIGAESFGGMTSSNILKVLNLAAKSLDKGESYLELGTYTGLTVIGAMLKNEDKQFIAVDDFSQYGGSAVELLENIHAFFPQGIPQGFCFYNLAIEKFFQNYSEKNIWRSFF